MRRVFAPMLAAVALVAWFGSTAHGHDLEVVAPPPVAAMETAATIEVAVEVRNRGDEPWSGADGWALAYHWLDEEGRPVIWDGRRSPFPEPVPAGECRVVTATLDAPARPGRYLLQWDVVREGVLWVSEVDPTPVAGVPVAVASSHGFTILKADTPRVLSAGGRRRATLTLRNDGLRVWPAAGRVFVAYHWFDGGGAVVEWEGLRTSVPGPVEPGETVTVEPVVAAPLSPGRSILRWDLVEDGVCWFSERAETEDPGIMVVVTPPVAVPPWLWSILVAALTATVVIVAGRHRAGGWATADVWWCVAAVVLKQHWVVGAAGVGFSASGWLFSVASAAALGGVLLLLPQRLRPWVSWSVVALSSAILFADLVYGRFFGDLVSMAALRSAGQIGRVGESIRSLLVGDDLWFWADLAVALPLVLACSRVRMPDRRSARAAGAAVGALALALAGAVVRDSSVSFRQVFQTIQLARHTGVLNLHLADAVAQAVKTVSKPRLTEGELEGAVEHFARHRSTRAGAGTLFGAGRSRNLVMIQVESLQSFVLGLRTGGEEVTPFLNELAAGAFTFSAVTDQTEEGRSSDSELATQVSLLPPDRGAAAFLFAGNDFTGLASVLAEQGYGTLSAVAFDGAFWNRRATHRAYGYERSLFAEDFAPGERIGWGLNDTDFLTQAADRLAGLPEPWCAYLLTLSLHHPFEGFPEHLEILDVGRWDGTPLGDYLHTMHHFDGALAGFFSALEREGLLGRTVVALWGDHDAGFSWRSEVAAVMGVDADAAGWYLSQRVPLVIRVPGVDGPGREMAVPAGHVDVAPTLLAIMGVDPSPLAYLGRNLLGDPGSGPVVGEYRCWQDETHLYLRRGPRLSDGECIVIDGMERVNADACAAGFEAARRQVEISRLVLEHDLQRRLRSDARR